VAPPRELREGVWLFEFPQEINAVVLWVLIHKIAVTECTRCRCKAPSNPDTHLLEIIMINGTDADLALFYCLLIKDDEMNNYQNREDESVEKINNKKQSG